MKYYYTYQTTMGKFLIASNEYAITNLYFEKDPIVAGQHFPEGYHYQETELLFVSYVQLCEYFAGNRKEFQLPIMLQGTDFMKSVWTAIAQIPYGETRTYSEIARAIGKPGAARAVGLANNRNPVPIFCPCHRVIGVGGKLVGYRGGIAFKRKLLELEQNTI